MTESAGSRVMIFSVFHVYLSKSTVQELSNTTSYLFCNGAGNQMIYMKKKKKKTWTGLHREREDGADTEVHRGDGTFNHKED